jgi:hypothetical protein
MKAWPILLAVALAAGTAAAQQNSLNQMVQSELSRHSDRDFVLVKKDKPNEIKTSRVTYGGLAVEAAKARSPLDLVNPAAPGYGPGDDNVHVDPITGRASGLTFFSIRF